MAIATKIKALLSLTNKNHADLAAYLEISPQALSNKLYRNSFSAEDLIKIAEFCGCSLVFQSDSGSIILDNSDLRLHE